MHRLILVLFALLLAAPLSAQTPAEDAATLRQIADRIEGIAPPPEFDLTLADTTVIGDVVVPFGETWLIGDSVTIEGNLRTDSGTIAMRPGSSLTFPSTPEQYVGGGMRYDSTFANDWGIWIGDIGVLDIQGTPKESWNRTGGHSTWSATDEYWIASTAVGDFVPRRWFPGDSVPHIDPRVPAAEVANVTRDISITGGHIHISSARPQTIEYVTLREMGVSNAAQEATTGRYALHFHMMGEGSRGTVVRGVASIGALGRVFVPHESHGITFEDNVAVNSRAEGFWWDLYDRTNDILVDRLGVMGVRQSNAVVGGTPQLDGISLCGGTNMTIQNSFVTGVREAIGSHGFLWPSECDNRGQAVWTFDEGNVVHNVEGEGIRFWFNRPIDHLTQNFVTYHNGAGVGNGAYNNSHHFADALLFEDKLLQHSSSQPDRVTGRGARFERLTVISRAGPALVTGGLNVAPTAITEFTETALIPGPGAFAVKVGNEHAGNRFWAVFKHCTTTGGRPLEPADVDIWRQADGQFPEALRGTLVRIEHQDGRVWEITIDMDSDLKIVTELP